ncbi:30S ribosomal protein S17 [Candidatus Woesearchaeota archaeon]|nr:30S ribosomal protein S17 [Candidatus Woesearchaeota archaeon]
MVKKQYNIGIDVPSPTEVCEDKHCPFHAGLKLRGRRFTGTVIKGDAHHTVTVEWPRIFYVSKYERYEKRRSRLKAHNPPCLNVKMGDKVEIMECRPISKTKSFVVINKQK